MINKICRIMLFTVCLACLFSSCDPVAPSKQLDRIKSLIDEHPDSALAALRSLDTLQFSSACSQAKYALLSAIAFDKNYIDTTNIRVIEPALKYYSQVNDKEHLAKAYYYKGKMLEVAGDRDMAANCYSFAYDLAESTNNYNIKGLVCAALSRIYSYNRNSKQELLFAQKAEECFRLNGDEKNAWIMQSIIPMCYANTYQWEISDSLYNVFFEQEILDTTIFANALFKAGKTKVRKGRPEPDVACELFEKAIKMGKSPTVDDFSVYVYALELTGNKDGVNSYLPALEQLKHNPKNAGTVNLWEYRLFKHRKEFENALSCFEGSIAAQDSMLIAILGHSLEKVQKDYYAEKSSRLSAENKTQRVTIILFIIIGALISSLLIWMIYRSRNKWIEKAEEAASLKNDLALMAADNAESNSSLAKLRKDYIQTFKEQFTIFDDLSSAYWSPSKRHTKERTLKVAVNALAKFSEAGKLEHIINSHFDNVMSKIRADLPNLSENSYRITCYLIIGFSPKTIAILMNMSVGSIYTAKNRIKIRFENLSSFNKAQYLELI